MRLTEEHASGAFVVTRCHHPDHLRLPSLRCVLLILLETFLRLAGWRPGFPRIRFTRRSPLRTDSHGCDGGASVSEY